MIINLQKVHKIVFVLLLFIILPCLAKSQAGANDPNFNITDNGKFAGTKGANAEVLASAIQSNNKTLIVGNFTTYNQKIYNRIVRLNADGNADATFKPGTAANDKITCVKLQADKKIIIAGNFTNYNGKQVGHITRLETNGTNDNTFQTGSGTNAAISHLLIQTNGKIIVAGNFTDYNGNPTKGLIRLTKSGKLDNAFNITDTLFNITAMVFQPDGKIIVSYSYNYVQTVIRLNADGSTDSTYTVNSSLFNNPFVPVIEAMVMQSNGKAIVASRFTRTNHRYSLLYRLNTNGEVDSTFVFNNLGVRRAHIQRLIIQENGEIIIVGNAKNSANTNDSVSYISRLTADGNFTTSFIENSLMENNGAIYNASVETNGKIIIHGLFSSIHHILSNNIARLNSDGSLDITFNKLSGANGIIKTTALQANKQLLIGGDFLSYNLVSRSHIARVDYDGKLDESFNPGAGTNGSINSIGIQNSISIQSDEKIIIGGNFTEYNGSSSKNLARLNTDGSLDTSFNIGTGVNGIVNTITIQPNGKCIVSGVFTDYNGVTAQNIVRLNENGSLDSEFYPTANTTILSVKSCELQPDGKIIISGNFYDNNNIHKNIIRLNTNGTVDTTFNCVAGTTYATVCLANGKIIIGGTYLAFKQMYYGFVDRLNTDGSKDKTFKRVLMRGAAENRNDVSTITIHDYDKIIVGGHFTYCNNINMDNLGALYENGIVDSTFYSHVNGDVYTTATLPDGKVIIAGDFSSYNDAPKNHIARIKFTRATSDIPLGDAISLKQSPLQEQLPILLYPNPTANDLTINNLTIGSKLMVRNALGKLVHSSIVTEQNTLLEVSTYANGIYFITNETTGFVSNVKFIVSK